MANNERGGAFSGNPAPQEDIQPSGPFDSSAQGATTAGTPGSAFGTGAGSVDVDRLRGPEGPQGPQGERGPMGDPGAASTVPGPQGVSITNVMVDDTDPTNATMTITLSDGNQINVSGLDLQGPMGDAGTDARITAMRNAADDGVVIETFLNGVSQGTVMVDDGTDGDDGETPSAISVVGSGDSVRFDFSFPSGVTVSY